MDQGLIRLIEDLAEELAEMPLAFLARAVGDSVARVSGPDRHEMTDVLRHDLDVLRCLWPTGT